MRNWAIGLFAAAMVAAAGQAWGDFVPTHGTLGPHLDPFVNGWNVPTGVAAGLGNVLAYPAPPANPQFDIVGPGAADFLFGFDNANSPGGWHWETEIDLNPTVSYNPPFPSVSVTLWGMSGQIIGTNMIPLVNGPDIYLEVHQMDMPETGAFFKGLINLTPIDVAWGTSVMEDPNLQLPDKPNKVVMEKCLYKGGGQQKELLEIYMEEAPSGTDFNTWVVAGDIAHGFNLYQADIPEPASLLVWLLLGISFGRVVWKQAGRTSSR